MIKPRLSGPFGCIVAAVTAMACETRATGEAGTPANAENDKENGSRSPARYR
jgi:hypothetical protein